MVSFDAIANHSHERRANGGRDDTRESTARPSDVLAEYAALVEGPGLVERRDRGLLEVTGRDRASWLHNLTTNEVKKLSVGEGHYAFVLNVQGRMRFDLNVLVRPDSILLDLDRGWLAMARAHFEKYAITEDVRVVDRSDEMNRLALTGEQSRELLKEIGASQAVSLPCLGTTEIQWPGAPVLLFRHDFCGVYGIEMTVPAGKAVDLRQWLCDKNRPVPAVPIGDSAVQIRRIEAGIPWPGREITEEYLPAETRQLARAVSTQKGCYLGQEVVERMRSRGVVARQLVGLLIEGGPATPGAEEHPGGDAGIAGAEIRGDDARPVGVVTSVCHSVSLGRTIALGYVKTPSSQPGGTVTVKSGQGEFSATVAALPFVGRAEH